MVAGEAVVTITPNFEKWIVGMDRLPIELEGVVERPWRAAADVMFDRSQQYVHVITGELKSSGKAAAVKVGPGEVTAEIEYDAPYAIYEEQRGGSHAYLTRAFQSTSDLFEHALPKAWEELVATWR